MIAGAVAGLATIACMCNPGGGPIVAGGTSPSGTPWTIRASHKDPAQVTFEFSFGAPGYEDAGSFTTLPYPVPHGFKLTATGGSDFDASGTADVSGITASRVVRVRIALADGSVVRFRPQRARADALRGRPWLRSFRVFEVFLQKGAEAREAVAFDAQGRVIARQRLS